MSSIYSECFIRTSAFGVVVAYNVPAGKRAVIRNLQIIQSATTTPIVQIGAAGVVIAQLLLPGAAGTWSYDTRVVVYAGSTISAYSTATGPAMTISGYLFNDSSGLRGPPGREEATPEPAMPEIPPEMWLAG